MLKLILILMNCDLHKGKEEQTDNQSQLHKTSEIMKPQFYLWYQLWNQINANMGVALRGGIATKQ